MCVSLGMLPPSLLGCLRPLPVHRGQVLSITREGRTQGVDAGAEQTLNIQWLGTACHSITLGDASLLTDPFVTYRGLLRVIFGKLRSDARQVERFLGPLDPPDAIFVGHSHYDHMLDLHAARLRAGWGQVPVYGSETTKNLLAGFGPGATDGVHANRLDSGWVRINDGLSYRAFSAEHAPQAKDILLYPGYVTAPRSTPPVRAGDFKCGDTYAYLFKLKKGDAEFTVFFMGSASTPPLGFPPPEIERVDVAILCVPGWKNVTGYPREFIRRLRPRQIVLTHFDNFIQEGRAWKSVIATAHLHEFIRESLAECSYPGFERIVVPDVGAVVRVGR